MLYYYLIKYIKCVYRYHVEPDKKKFNYISSSWIDLKV